MAGRRVRNAVHRVLSAAWGADVKVVITTYTNTYSSYTTTYEEYQVGFGGGDRGGWRVRCRVRNRPCMCLRKSSGPA